MAPVLAFASSRYLGEADFFRCRALEREFRGILQDQDGAIRGLDPLRRRRKVTFQDFVFADAFIGKKPIRRLGIRPVLECGGQRFARPFADGRQDRPKSTVQTRIAQLTFRSFLAHPTLPHARTRLIEGARE